MSILWCHHQWCEALPRLAVGKIRNEGFTPLYTVKAWLEVCGDVGQLVSRCVTDGLSQCFEYSCMAMVSGHMPDCCLVSGDLVLTA